MSKKDDDRIDKDKLLDVVHEYCASKEFEAEFEAFAKEHTDVFLQSLDFGENSSEHPHEFHEVYQKYLSKFEGLIEECITKTGYTVNEFFDLCKDILASDEIFGTKRFFVETMLATSEYDSFFMLMRAEMRSNQQNPTAAAAPSNHK
mmetsp:Transcript_9920/g.16623  ORF Transcript_9920/g.16623 Transcript_9920/m.16623 type:complete len:147 (-) Transcript_9920:387-827(-)